MEDNKYEVGVSVQTQTQRHHTLLFFSTGFLCVPRGIPGSQEQKCPCRTEGGPGGARGCLKWLHEELIQNRWGQQRATLQGPGPTDEYALSFKVRARYLGFAGSQGWRDRIRHRWRPPSGIVQKRAKPSMHCIQYWGYNFILRVDSLQAYRQIIEKTFTLSHDKPQDGGVTET